jgi:hypothetical protein
MNMRIHEIDSSIGAAALAYGTQDSWKIDNAPRFLHSLHLGLRSIRQDAFAVESPAE